MKPHNKHHSRQDGGPAPSRDRGGGCNSRKGSGARDEDIVGLGFQGLWARGAATGEM